MKNTRSQALVFVSTPTRCPQFFLPLGENSNLAQATKSAIDGRTKILQKAVRLTYFSAMIISPSDSPLFRTTKLQVNSY